MLDFNNTIAIVRTCVNANRADLIENALFDGQSVDELRAIIDSERPTRPAAARSNRSRFDGPTPQQRDALTEAVRRRFEAMAAKSGA